MSIKIVLKSTIFICVIFLLSIHLAFAMDEELENSKHYNSPKISLLNLPEEIKDIIIIYSLDEKRSIFQLAQVCHALNEAVKRISSMLIWEMPIKMPMKYFTIDNFLKNYFSPPLVISTRNSLRGFDCYESSIRHLKVSSHNFDSNVKWVSFSNLPLLQSLSLKDNDTDLDLDKRISQFPSLAVLELSFCNHATDAIQLFSLLQNLQILKLEWNKIDEEKVQFVQYLTNLRELSLANNSLGNNLEPLTTLSNLTCLDLSQNKICSPGIKYLGELKKLTTLNLSNNFLKDEGVAYLSGLTSLLTLNLWTNQITSRGINSLYFLHSIENLYLGNNQLTSIVEVIRSFPKLKILTLSYNFLITGREKESGEALREEINPYLELIYH